jgi:arylsulfatase A-like enzyme
LVSDRWHLIVEQSGKTELYDFRTDPGELTDLASDSTAVVANLRERFAGLVPGPIR